MNRDDILWKSILEDIFEDFLKFFFPEAEKIFDIEKGFVFLDKELRQICPAEDMKAPKHVDKLVEIFTRDGKEEQIYLHIEVQGYKDNKSYFRFNHSNHHQSKRIYGY
jgi:hypothetical protein